MLRLDPGGEILPLILSITVLNTARTLVKPNDAQRAQQPARNRASQHRGSHRAQL